ncbi:MAG: shikimate kinase [Clostridia bacterium]|nr:shikimate kinase [Clostridia bacterium]
MNIVLIGMPASGKSTVARELAKSLRRKAIDTDGEIIKEYGDINWIFAELGEESFRNIETEIIKACAALDKVVISTGGGCILRRENVNLLKRNGKIVYLSAGVQTLLKRVKGNSSRPLLAGDAEKKLLALYEKRAPLYESAADYTVETDGLTPKQICKKIRELKI